MTQPAEQACNLSELEPGHSFKFAEWPIGVHRHSVVRHMADGTTVYESYSHPGRDRRDSGSRVIRCRGDLKDDPYFGTAAD